MAYIEYMEERMDIYSTTMDWFYCPREFKDYWFNVLKNGQRKTVVVKYGEDVDFRRDHKNNKLAVICYRQDKNEVYFLLNHYWTK